MKIVISELDGVVLENMTYLQALIVNQQLYIKVNDIIITREINCTDLEIVFPKINFDEIWFQVISKFNNFNITLSYFQGTSILCFGMCNITFNNVTTEEVILHNNHFSISLINTDIETLYVSHLKNIQIDKLSNIDKSYITINETDLVHIPNININDDFGCVNEINSVSPSVLGYIFSI